MGYNLGPSRYVRGWDVYIPERAGDYAAARHVRFEERRFHMGIGPLSPCATSNYFHPKEHGMTEDDDWAEYANGTGLEADQELAASGEHTACTNAGGDGEAHREIELGEAAPLQEQCKTPGCTKPLHHPGAHSNEQRQWSTPGKPAERTRQKTNAERGTSDESPEPSKDTSGTTLPQGWEEDLRRGDEADEFS